MAMSLPVWILLSSQVAGAGTDADSTTVSLRPPLVLPAATVFDSITRIEYLRRRATSLDQFLEYPTGIVIVRQGPVGFDAAFSRYGIGRGRALLFVDGIPMNNPQNDIAPLVDTPVSGLGVLRLGDDGQSGIVRGDAIEGVAAIIAPPPPESRPATSLELSNGNNALRQRRVRVSSAQRKVGVDLHYDEVLNDGYAFDASDPTRGNGTDFGHASSRNTGFSLRGKVNGGDGYQFGFRRFVSGSDGDLASVNHETRRSGHLAMLGAEVGDVRLTLFGRGFDTTAPDSSTVNETVGGYAALRAVTKDKTSVLLKAGLEEITSTQDVGGEAVYRQIVRTAASVEASAPVGARTKGHTSASVRYQRDVAVGWGVSASAHHARGRHRLEASIARTFRMPNLGELYGPEHASGTRRLSGNDDANPESAWEVWAGASSSLGALNNHVRAGLIRVQDPLGFAPLSAGPSQVWKTSNGEGGRLGVVEEKMRAEWGWLGLNWRADAAVSFTTGDREGFFSSAAQTRAFASASFGQSLFEATSALYFGAEFAYSDARRDFSGNELPSYGVLNFTIDGRLLDAHVYLKYFNALDEKYQTVEGYLMTPRSLVYGIAWTLFD